LDKRPPESKIKVNSGGLWKVRAMQSEHILELKKINKKFPGVQALSNVDLSLGYGEVRCLVGENGSGKTTLVKIISGAESPTSGTIVLKGNTYKYLTVRQAIREGIQVIYQDLALFPDLTAWENIMFNWLIEESEWFVRKKELMCMANDEMERLGVSIDLNEQISNLSMSKRQIIAIARALVLKAKLIIFDEPTAALTKKEIDTLLSIILELKQRDITTIFISHKLDEIFKIADSITVLRDGFKVGDFEPSELDEKKLAFYMTGREITYKTFEPKVESEKRVLEVRNLAKNPHFKNISFYVEKGEIVGIIGPLGSGRTELMLSLFGLNKPQRGDILFEGKPLNIDGPVQAREIGIALLPEDRHSQGLFIKMNIADNLTATILEKLKNLITLNLTKLKKRSNFIFNELRIKAPSLETVVETLSGGNQQKVVLGKWLAMDPKLLILDSPTVGIDIGSKAEIYKIAQELAQKGMAIILVSDEIPEIYYNCNRVIVMRDGNIVATFDTKETTEEEIRNVVEGRL